MTYPDLAAIVDQRMNDPQVLGRLACRLRSNDVVRQRHHDGSALELRWEDAGDFWRCVISSSGSTSEPLAQIDLHDNATVRVEVFDRCHVTIAPEEGFLCLTRYRTGLRERSA